MGAICVITEVVTPARLVATISLLIIRLAHKVFTFLVWVRCWSSAYILAKDCWHFGLMHTNAVSRRAPGALFALIGIGMLKDEKRDTEHRVCPAQSWFYIGEVCFLKRVGHCSVLLFRIKSGHLKRGLRQEVKQISIHKVASFFWNFASGPA